MNAPNEQSARDFSLAHALLRVGLGLNLFTHGLVRLPDLASFAAHTRQTMAQSPLPGPLVVAAGYVIPLVEITTGTLLLLGLFLRPALVLGFLLLLVLMLGICLAQNWTVAAEQLVYMLVLAALLATARHDRYSVDAWRAREARTKSLS